MTIKAKFALEHATRHGEGLDVQLYSFLKLHARRGWAVNTTLGLFTPGKDPEPIVREAAWAQGRFGRVRKD